MKALAHELPESFSRHVQFRETVPLQVIFRKEKQQLSTVRELTAGKGDRTISVFQAFMTVEKLEKAIEEEHKRAEAVGDWPPID